MCRTVGVVFCQNIFLVIQYGSRFSALHFVTFVIGHQNDHCDRHEWKGQTWSAREITAKD